MLLFALAGLLSRKMLDLLIPRFPLRQLPAMLAIAAVGAVAAALFGIVHDQLTYTLAPEYFTRLKFHQFAWADLGLPRRVFVAEIGFLASWWVGLISGWLLARAGAADLPSAVKGSGVLGGQRLDHWQSSRPPKTPDPLALRWSLVGRAFVLVALVTLAASFFGWLCGNLVVANSSLSSWQIARTSLGVRDLPSFVIVAYIHNATYVGAAIGIVSAILDVRRRNTGPQR